MSIPSQLHSSSRSSRDRRRNFRPCVRLSPSTSREISKRAFWTLGLAFPAASSPQSRRDGFRFELGPQSFLSTEPLLKLIDALGLKDQLLQADPKAPRYILSGGKLIPAFRFLLPHCSQLRYSARAQNGASILNFFAGIRVVIRPRKTNRSPRLSDESLARNCSTNWWPLSFPGRHAGDPERLSLARIVSETLRI